MQAAGLTRRLAAHPPDRRHWPSARTAAGAVGRAAAWPPPRVPREAFQGKEGEASVWPFCDLASRPLNLLTEATRHLPRFKEGGHRSGCEMPDGPPARCRESLGDGMYAEATSGEHRLPRGVPAASIDPDHSRISSYSDFCFRRLGLDCPKQQPLFQTPTPSAAPCQVPLKVPRLPLIIISIAIP